MPKPLTREKDTYPKYLAKGMFIVVVIALVMMVCSRRGILHQWEMYGVDPLLGSQSFKSDIRLVEITDEDYARWFKSCSPLSRPQVENLIMAVARANPELIVVDLDVSDPSACDRDAKPGSVVAHVQQGISKLHEPRPDIVWTQTVQPVQGSLNCPYSQTVPAGIVEAPVAGFESGDRALPLFPRDRDGVVRSSLRTARVWNNGKCELLPTLAWAAHLRWLAHRGGAGPNANLKESNDELFLNFSGDRYTFIHADAGSILSEAMLPAGRDPLARVLGGKIVIIGGSFEAARDRYFTPVGEMPGMELIAFALESENQGKGIRHGKEIGAFCFDLLLGAAIVSIWYRWEGWPAIAGSLAAAVILPVLLSYLLFSSWNFFLNFVPVAIGALAHIAADAIRELPKKEKTIEEKVKEIESLKAQIEAMRSSPEMTDPGSHDINPSATAVDLNDARAKETQA